jgi:methionyl-tRNA formyltransferase
MNIIFMGTPEFALPSLKALLLTHHNISAVVTAADKPKGRGLKLSESPVKMFALKNNLRVLQPPNLKEESFINEIKSLEPDLIVVIAFRILPGEVYTIAKSGSVNLHASLLPKYRGAAPINWAIINGENQSGVTTFFLKDEVDTGNILLQKKCEITSDDDAGSLHQKLSELGAETILDTVRLIEANKGKVPVFSQDESLASPAPKIFKEDCKINWNKPAGKLYDFIRALSPYPGAFTISDGKTIKIFKTRITDENTLNHDPGTVIISDNRIFVVCLNSVLEIIELQIEGKKKMPAADFLRGNKIITRFSF